MGQPAISDEIDPPPHDDADVIDAEIVGGNDDVQ
jgi:hypothetical protein